MQIIRLPIPLHGIAFDIDNTLYTDAVYAKHQEDVLIARFAEHNGCTAEEGHYRIDRYRRNFSLYNDGKKPSLGNSFLSFGISIQVSVRWRNELIHPEDFLHPDAQLRETMHQLFQHYRLIAVTNNPQGVGRRGLEALGVAEFFMDVIGLDSCWVSKPNPKLFRLAAERCGVAASEMVSIGDRTEVDLEPAMEVGMGAIRVDSVHDVYQLPEVLG